MSNGIAQQRLQHRPAAPPANGRRGGRRRRLLQEVAIKAVPLALFLALWEIGADVLGAIDVPGVGGTLRALVDVMASAQTWSALLESNKALVIGYAAAVAVGLPLGLLIGRMRTADALVQGWLSILLITPMAMIIPIIIMALGFGVTGRSLIIFIFVLPMILVNCRTGVRTTPTDLIDMGRSFGASERQLWRFVILPGAAPSVFAGLRIGIGRAVTGMVIAEWLLAAVGVGALLLQFRGSFQADALFAVIIIILIESLLLVQVIRMIERRLAGWAGP
jgi:ABC-type nitrate/sulfonate/bicarbonate transport system permease component